MNQFIKLRFQMENDAWCIQHSINQLCQTTLSCYIDRIKKKDQKNPSKTFVINEGSDFSTVTQYVCSIAHMWY